MDKSIQAAIQLFEYGLTPIPLIGKRPILEKWPTRFIEKPIEKKDIFNGIFDKYGKITTFSGKNVGVLTGKISNCIVLDIDNLSALLRLEKLGALPLTWKVRSNRGIHLYFNYNEKIPSMRIWDSIDILSEKKQVVAPPSIHPSGVLYRWEISPEQVEKADLPTWLVEYLLKYQSNKYLNESSTKKTNSKQVYKKRGKFKSVDINELLKNIDWVNFYSRFTSNIRGNGEWLSSKCPFHSDHHNSFSFNRVNGGWICFAGCGSGNGIKAVQELYRINFQQALKLINGDDLYV